MPVDADKLADLRDKIDSQRAEIQLLIDRGSPARLDLEVALKKLDSACASIDLIFDKFKSTPGR